MVLKYQRIATQDTFVLSVAPVTLSKIIFGESASNSNVTVKTGDGMQVLQLDAATLDGHVDFDLPLDGLTIVSDTANPEILVIWKEWPVVT